MIDLSFLVLEFDIEGLGKVLSQKMRGAGLQGFSILHKCLYTVCFEGPGESFAFSLYSPDHGDGQNFFQEFCVNAKHGLCFLNGFGLCGMRRVSLLPEEFCGPQEQTGTHLPANHIRPLIDENGEIPVTLDPIAIGVPNDGLRGGANDQFFLQACILIDHHSRTILCILQAVVGHHGAFFGKALYVIGFFAEVAFGNEYGEVGILMSGLFEPSVQVGLHGFPYRIPIGLDDHAAADTGVLSKICLDDQIVVPLRIIFFSFR